MKKQFLLFLFALLPMLAMADKSGSCGYNVTYTYNSTTKTLTIQGSGAMYDYDIDSGAEAWITSAPWKNYVNQIKEVIINDGVTSIGTCAFCGCSGLTAITIPSGVMGIGGLAFAWCENIASISVENGNGTYDSRDNCNAIIETASNTLIAGCKNTVIPNSVTSIGDGAFFGCSGLTTITIPNSVTSIGGYAFFDCSGLTSIDCKITNVFNINDNTFDNTFSDATYNNAELHILGGLRSKYQQATGWKKFNTITEDKNVFACGDHLIATYSDSDGKLIIQGDGAMWDNSSSTSVPWNSYKTNISTIIIEDGATSIGKNAFNGCTDLYSVAFGKGITSVGTDAFKNCSNVKKVIASDVAAWCGIDFANETANPLYYTKKLYQDETTEITALTIPDKVTRIGSYAFYGCSSLTSITIPNSVTSIGSGAFDMCSGLQKVIVPDISAWCGISFADNIANPLYYAHHIYSDKNTEITEIVIPGGVNIIGQYAFYNCENITSVTIPSSVTSIGKNAFSCGIKLSTVNVNMNIPIEIDESVFEFTGENYSKDIIYLAATLNVPIGSKALYSNVEGWKKFANIQETEFTGVETIKQKSTPTSYYSVSGEKRNNVHRGINIIRMSDGTTRKVVVK